MPLEKANRLTICKISIWRQNTSSPEKPTVSIVDWSAVYYGESVLRSLLRSAAKTRLECGWTTLNKTSKLSHFSVCSQLWANALPILMIALFYAIYHSKSKLLGYLICLSLSKYRILSISDPHTTILKILIVSGVASSIVPSDCSATFVLARQHN